MNLDALVSTLAVALIVLTLGLIISPIVEIVADINNMLRRRRESAKNREWLSELAVKHPLPWDVEFDALCPEDTNPRGTCWKVVDSTGRRILPNVSLGAAAILLAFSRDPGAIMASGEVDLSCLDNAKASQQAA